MSGYGYSLPAEELIEGLRRAAQSFASTDDAGCATLATYLIGWLEQRFSERQSLHSPLIRRPHQEILVAVLGLSSDGAETRPLQQRYLTSRGLHQFPVLTNLVRAEGYQILRDDLLAVLRQVDYGLVQAVTDCLDAERHLLERKFSELWVLGQYQLADRIRGLSPGQVDWIIAGATLVGCTWDSGYYATVTLQHQQTRLCFTGCVDDQHGQSYLLTEVDGELAAALTLFEVLAKHPQAVAA